MLFALSSLVLVGGAFEEDGFVEETEVVGDEVVGGATETLVEQPVKIAKPSKTLDEIAALNRILVILVIVFLHIYFNARTNSNTSCA